MTRKLKHSWHMPCACPSRVNSLEGGISARKVFAPFCVVWLSVMGEHREREAEEAREEEEINSVAESRAP